MAASFFSKLVCLLLVCMVAAVPFTEAAVTCGAVAGSLAPCIPYAKGTGAGPVPSTCCGGIKSLNTAATTPLDRQTTCKCLKAISTGISGINYNLVAGIPGKCGVSVPYKISPSTNCNNVK